MANSCRGPHFPKDVILFAVFFYVRMTYPIATLRKFSLNAK